ncbi:MAG: extracellular solute-binding protein [Candidatus Hydrogenedentes bacterium]|nr:extracellular solute-binding protein [Candidatus Hydrogenedentota bacterium]
MCLMGCSARDVLVVYSPHGPEMLKDYETLFEAAYPGVDLQWLDMGSQEVFNRVSAEGNRPAGDVWWGGPSTMFVKAAEEGLLDTYRPSWAGVIDAVYKDARDRWYGTFRTPLAVLFNNTRYTKDTAPKTWDDLVSPAWRGRVALRKPSASGSMRVFLGAMISRASSEDAGFAWLKRLHEATESYPESPQFLFDHLKRNPEVVSVWVLPDIILQRERNGFPFDGVVPPDTPVLTEGIGIVKNAPHPERARQFYEFVTTTAALIHQAHAYAKMPVRADVDSNALPAWMREPLQAMPIDWAAFAQKEQTWCDRWEREVYAAK